MGCRLAVERIGIAAWAGGLDEERSQVYMDYVFDKKYDVPSYHALNSNNHYGEPRSVMLTVRHTPTR